MRNGTLFVIQMKGRFPGLIADGSKPLETRKNLDGWSPRHDGVFTDLPVEMNKPGLYCYLPDAVMELQSRLLYGRRGRRRCRRSWHWRHAQLVGASARL